VAHEVFVLHRKTQRLELYTPLSRRAVLLRCLLVYAWAGFVASWHLWGVLPILSLPMHGFPCVLIDYHVPSTVFFWLAYIPALSGVSTVYATVIGYICWRDRLIRVPPPKVRPLSLIPVPTSSSNSGPNATALTQAPKALANVISLRSMEQRSRQARSPSIYFARIFLVFYVMWTPTLLLLFVTSFRSPWPVWAGGAWAHLAGLVSALIGMYKPDVGPAVYDLLSCGNLIQIRSPPRISVAVSDARCMGTESDRESTDRIANIDK
jgi:hypothetical protein